MNAELLFIYKFFAKNKKNLLHKNLCKRFFIVRMEGLEPTRLAALDPKSSASANFATSAKIVVQKYFLFSY